MPRFGRRNRQREWELALATAREELAAAGDAVGVLDVEVQSPGAPELVGERFEAAIRAFMAAGERLEGAQDARAQDPRALVGIGEALERTRYELASARALLDGTEIPGRSAPCVFDPAHGPSVREVPWSPGDAGERTVPACASDAQRVIDGQAPRVRRVALGERPAYYWDVPYAYGSLIEGYFGEHGGAERLAELLAGTPLGELMRSGGMSS